MTITLLPHLHEREYQRHIKSAVEKSLHELGLRGYWVRWNPYENRGDLFILDDAGRDILVVEVKKTHQDVSSPRYWDQARKYVLNSRNWQPGAPKLFCITNAEELYVFGLRADFTHIKYCLLERGKINNGRFGSNGEADEVLDRFKESMKGVLGVCLGNVPVRYDQNWYPILERFRVEWDSLSKDLLNSLDQTLSDSSFRRSFKGWSKSLYPYYSELDRKKTAANQTAASMMFKALCYEVIRNLLKDIPRHKIKDIRLSSMSTVDKGNMLDSLADLYTDIVRIDYRNIFETDVISDTLTLSPVGRASLSTFLATLRSIPNARQEISDPDFLVASLVNTLIPPVERHETGLTIEDKSMVGYLAHICIDDPSYEVIDIAAGTCAILEGAYDRLKELKVGANQPAGHKEILKQISAIESDKFIARVGALRFILKNLLEETELHIKIKDAFSLKPNADYDVILCNPPYLRQADIPVRYKEHMRHLITEGYRSQGVTGDFPYSGGQADKYFYFFEWGLLFIRPGGTAGFILSDKFLNNKTGEHLKRFMLEQTNLKAIIQYPGRHFEGFDVTTCFVVTERKNGRVDPNNKTRFIRLFQDVTPERLSELLVAPQSSNTPGARVTVEGQASLDPREKWGKKLLSLPQTYDDCYGRVFMRSLKQVFGGRVKRGRDNGCNAFFFSKSTSFTKGRGESDDDFRWRRRVYRGRVMTLINNIEREFMKPGLNSADLPSNYILQNNDLKKEPLLVVPQSTDLEQNAGLKKFVNFAERTYADKKGETRALLDGMRARVKDRTTIRNRSRRLPWYSLYSASETEDDYALLIPRMHRAAFKVLIPRRRVYFSTNFGGFGKLGGVTPDDIKLIAGFLVSSLGQLQFEADGDWREGLLKIEAGQLYKIKAPYPSLIGVDKKKDIVAAFEDLGFGLNGLERPGRDNPRFELDKAVMALFYPRDECEDRAIEIEEALFQTVQERDPENRRR